METYSFTTLLTNFIQKVKETGRIIKYIEISQEDCELLLQENIHNTQYQKDISSLLQLSLSIQGYPIKINNALPIDTRYNVVVGKTTKIFN